MAVGVVGITVGVSIRFFVGVLVGLGIERSSVCAFVGFDGDNVGDDEVHGTET